MSDPRSAHARLHKLQHRIYKALEREADALLGTAPSSIRNYQRESERDLAGKQRFSTKEELVGAIRDHDVTLIADFHTFAQAQRTALRLMRETVLPDETWALGVELIPSQYQAALDDFQAGRIETRKFHELIRYREHWGFPWKNYEPLFAWAREHEVRLIALNRPRELLYRGFASPRAEKRGRDLHARDQWAAGVITDLFQAQPELKMLVLYGGHHVGRAHLPKQIEKVSRAFLGRALTSLSIHQNHVGTYWKLARQERELHAQVLKLKGGNAYCVFSATPWAQLQSLISSAEGEDLEEESSNETDYLSLMSAYGGVIAEFLGVEKASFGSLNLRTIEEADFVEAFSKGLSAGEIQLVKRLIGANERFYLPRSQIAYLASPSQNAAAEYAAVHLLRLQSRNRDFFLGEREDFFRVVLEAAFGFLGSLILNPRRKCDLPQDHVRRLKQLARGSVPAYADERETREAVLALSAPRKREALLAGLPKRASSRAFPTLIAARGYGRILAKRLHPTLLGLRHGSDEFKKISALFLRKRRFEDACAELFALAGRKVQKTAVSKSDVI